MVVRLQARTWALLPVPAWAASGSRADPTLHPEPPGRGVLLTVWVSTHLPAALLADRRNGPGRSNADKGPPFSRPFIFFTPGST